MSGLQVAMSLHERDVGPMPEKASHAKIMWFFTGGER